MGHRLVEGTCHICGVHGKLSFEHVPPRRAFNDRPLLLQRFEDLEKEGPESRRGRISQLGAGGYTLCERCNNVTGSWYGPAFIEWAYQGMGILQHTESRPSLYYPFHICPLRVIKQIICMFFSANSDKFHQAQPDLVRLVLNQETRGLDPKIRIFVYFNASGRSRMTGVAAAMNIFTGTVQVISEISFPPFGYVMALSSRPSDERLVDISFMADFRYKDWKDVSLKLPVLPIYTMYPGDYRDRATVLREADESRRTYREEAAEN